ncbi:unnamed protein product, partial [marine sediment metagenome]
MTVFSNKSPSASTNLITISVDTGTPITFTDSMTIDYTKYAVGAPSLLAVSNIYNLT